MSHRSKAILSLALGVLFIGFAIAGFATGSLVVAIVGLLIGLADLFIAFVFFNQTRQLPRDAR